MNKISELNHKWWYRLLKVVYVFSFLFSFIIPIILFTNNKPYLNVYDSRYALNCDDGRTRGDFDTSDLNDSFTDFDYFPYNPNKHNELTRMAKMACEYKETGDDLEAIYSNTLSFVPDIKNYEIVRIKDVYIGSWFSAIGYFLIGVIGILIIFNLIRSIFLYVVLGTNFWKVLTWRKTNQNENK